MEIRRLLRETQCKLTIFMLENTRVILKNLTAVGITRFIAKHSLDGFAITYS
jgi:hypothetical protein